MNRKRFILTLSVMTLILGACAATTGMGSAQQAAGGHDSWVAGMVATANEGEVQQGTAAASRATNADVRAFAQMMVTDHTNALQALRDTASRAGVTPQESDASRTLRDASQETVRNLGTYTGASFDRRYMQSQVDLHQWLLNQLDTVLIPSTSNAEMRSLLQTQRASVAAHLQQATQIRGRL
jgi:putative membrane protein